MKKIVLNLLYLGLAVLIVVSIFDVASAGGKPTEKDAVSVLRQHFKDKGASKLLTVNKTKKTDGKEHNLFGVSAYMMYFDSELEFLDNTVMCFNTSRLALGGGTPFFISITEHNTINKMDVLEKIGQGRDCESYKSFNARERLKIDGNILFQKYESGWKGEDVTINWLQIVGKLLKSRAAESKAAAMAKEERQRAEEKKMEKAIIEELKKLMVLVKGGCFQMGDAFGYGGSGEKPVHEVCVDDFYIGKYEVTQKEWMAVMGNNPSDFKGCDNCPVEQVSWNDIQEFINKLNQKTGKKYRLPTEAEWEYAARSGGKNEIYAGFSNKNELYLYANFCDSNCEYNWKIENQNDGYKNTSPVGKFKPNGLGIYDMSGNVWEWVNDWYDGDYYKNSPKDNPKGASSGQYRALRGGSWLVKPGDARAAYRVLGVPAIRSSSFGFRLLLSAQ